MSLRPQLGAPPVHFDGDSLLEAALTVAVPIRIDEIRDWPAEQRVATARPIADVIGEKGDIILYRSKKRGETAAAFNQLVTALACLAYQPGGVRFASLAWEVGS